MNTIIVSRENMSNDNTFLMNNVVIDDVEIVSGTISGIGCVIENSSGECVCLKEYLGNNNNDALTKDDWYAGSTGTITFKIDYDLEEFKITYRPFVVDDDVDEAVNMPDCVDVHRNYQIHIEGTLSDILLINGTEENISYEWNHVDMASKFQLLDEERTNGILTVKGNGRILIKQN